jgi:uncharacterized membrane protein YedE/YeeE
LNALGAGALFGAGLWLSGMTDPRNVIGFLDFTGAWNPSLAVVMVGAIAVHATALRLLGPPGRSSVRPLAALRGAFERPLVLGSALFGVGWGLAGYCPGPAIVSLGFGAGPAWPFAAALVVGVLAADLVMKRPPGPARRPR